MAKFLVLATSAFFLLYGLAFTILPEQFSMLVTQSVPQSPSGLIDFRATYGGMTMAVGALLALTTQTPAMLRLGLRSVAIILLLMAAGRTVGLVLDGAANSLMYIYLAAELITAGVAIYLLSTMPKHH